MLSSSNLTDDSDDIHKCSKMLQAWASILVAQVPVEILGIQEPSQVDQWRCQLGGWKGDPFLNQALDHGCCLVTCHGISWVHEVWRILEAFFSTMSTTDGCNGVT